VSIDFGVYGVPETFVIDAEGRIVGKHDGAVTEEWLRSHLDRLSSPRRTTP
jgi:cytochrome c biogenesis protein CcmG/thiol:disulfide interchange protein DsbE